MESHDQNVLKMRKIKQEHSSPLHIYLTNPALTHPRLLRLVYTWTSNLLCDGKNVAVSGRSLSTFSNNTSIV